MPDSYTAKNTRKHGGKPFDKGDIRINRLGRPRSFDRWRRLNQQILTELAIDENNKPIIIKVITLDKNGKQIIKEHYATKAEMIARGWANGEKGQQQAIEAAYGKVKDEIEHTGADGGPIKVEDVTLTDDERIAELIKLLDAARARQAGQTDPPAG